MASSILSLRPMPDGCALVSDRGEIVFRSYGPFARRLCLRHAARAGVVCLAG